MSLTQTTIADVTTDSRFTPHRGIAAASGFRSVQSTPLVDKAGRLIGVVSTHYPWPRHPAWRDALLMQHYTALAGSVIADRLRAGSGLPPDSGEIAVTGLRMGGRPRPERPSA
jgi:hypothetical protein